MKNFNINVVIIIFITGFIFLNGCSESTGKQQDFKFDNYNGKPNDNSIKLNTGNIEHLTSASFKEKVFDYESNTVWKYEGSMPCIVDFYADWCAPCKKIAPVLESISKEYDGKIKIYKVNVDEQQQLAAAFGIQSIPSILFVPKSGQPQMVTGALPKEGFVQAIKDILLN